MQQEAQDVVDFWREAGPKMWFAKDDDFDKEFKRRFYDLHFAAARREKEGWREHAYSALALVLLLDQFPRNAFRNTGHMFATDPLALMYAKTIIETDQIMRIEPQLRTFACVPFMHSERLDDQAYALQLYTEHAPDAMSWAVDHHAIIERFGRFPHRNFVLGRATTDEEQRFLDDGGFAG